MVFMVSFNGYLNWDYFGPKNLSTLVNLFTDMVFRFREKSTEQEVNQIMGKRVGRAAL